MMQSIGFDETSGTKFVVHEYTNEGSTSTADHHHIVLSNDELITLSTRDHTDTSVLYDKDINNSKLTTAFNAKLRSLLIEHVRDHDLVLHVFGPAPNIVTLLPYALHVESGIGYSCGANKAHFVCPFRIFESHTWRAYHAGARDSAHGTNYAWTIANYYDPLDWPLVTEPEHKNTVLFFGRVVDVKGIMTVCEIARRMPHLRFKLVGQAYNKTKWVEMSPGNVTYHEPVMGNDRATLLGNVRCMLTPTKFREPFCGSATEANLCGTPVISTDFGVFGEKIENGVNGYRCNTLADFMVAIEKSVDLDRSAIRRRAVELYSFPVIAKQYATAFNQIAKLKPEGWYGPSAFTFPDADLQDMTVKKFVDRVVLVLSDTVYEDVGEQKSVGTVVVTVPLNRDDDANVVADFVVKKYHVGGTNDLVVTDSSFLEGVLCMIMTRNIRVDRVTCTTGSIDKNMFATLLVEYPDADLSSDGRVLTLREAVYVVSTPLPLPLPMPSPSTGGEK
jgi:glycosyltransferase involved in cell wall biosynthesis